VFLRAQVVSRCSTDAISTITALCQW